MLLRDVLSFRFDFVLVALVCLLAGLLLDPGHPGQRATAGHVLQLVAIVLLGWTGFRVAGGHVALAVMGIALVSVGVLLEMRVGYEVLRGAVAFQVAGDVFFATAFAVAIALRDQRPSAPGWVFIAISGLLSLYAALANLVLQIGRLRNPKVGWRYRVLELGEQAMRVRTLEGEARIPWSQVESVRRLDGRHVLLVLPSPLPPELSKAGLPLEELRREADAGPPGEGPPPDRFALVLHEQELGFPLEQAEKLLQSHLSAPPPSGAGS